MSHDSGGRRTPLIGRTTGYAPGTPIRADRTTTRSPTVAAVPDCVEPQRFSLLELLEEPAVVLDQRLRPTHPSRASARRGVL
jgi:hypothetical protein